MKLHADNWPVSSSQGRADGSLARYIDVRAGRSDYAMQYVVSLVASTAI